MAFCGKCGSSVADGVLYCPQCGAPVGGSAPPPVAMTSAGTEGLAENVAGLLCYVLGWLTGIIFLLIDKRPFVKFHAAQSIVVFGGLTVIRIALLYLHGVVGGGFISWGFVGLISLLVGLVTIVLWI